VTHNQDTVKLMVIAVGKASVRTTRIALDLVHNASEITRRRLIEPGLDQDTACIGGQIGKNRPDVRKEEIKIRLRYGADGALKNASPRPFSPPRPTQRPGAGCVFRHSLPLSPLRPPPHSYPRRVPVKNRW